MPVNTVKAELKNRMTMYDMIDDCIQGQEAIKKKREKYLPRPNSEDVSQENLLRYNSYLDRAVFYGATKRTLGGLVGQVFSRDPVIKVPDALNPVVEDATGLGVNIIQSSKEACNFVLAHGRAGIFIDYPQMDQPQSVADIQSGRVRPTFRVYHPKKVINWRTTVIDFKRVLSMVVLEEPYTISDDGYLETVGKQWRVLSLGAFGYTIQVWRDTRPNATLVSQVVPLNFKGEIFTTLPFTFIGCDDNDPDTDDPPLFDLAALNIAHYRNSADYEEACFITGQPTPYFTGLTEQWVKNVFKGSVQLGSRAAVPLPSGATAGLLQITANSMPFEAMQHKERLMSALGAKLVEQRQVQRTATETGVETKDETSILSTTADNVSDAYEFALKFAAQFVGADTTEIEFDLNTQFDLIKLSPQDRQQVLAEWISEAISFTEMRANLRRAGLVNQDDATASAEIKANPPPDIIVPGQPVIKPNTPPATPPANGG